MSVLRILHVVPYYEHAWAYGGIPRLATAMTRGLARRGHDVTVCTTDACDRESRAPRPTGPGAHARLTVHVFPNLSNSLAYWGQFFTPVGLTAYLREHAQGFDVAHLHACRNVPVAIAARLLARGRVPYVISPNGTAPPIERRILAKRVFDWAERGRTLGRAARVIAVSEAERDQLRRVGVAAHRIAIVPNPIDEAEFAHPPDGDRFRHRHSIPRGSLVLFLGKLTPRKGVDVLVRAFGLLDPPAATLAIAGNDMGSGGAVDALTTTLGREGRVRRIGLLKGSERLDALAAADVVVYPSRDEVFGLVAAEALLCGTPVVVCDDSGCGEIVSELGGGLRVPHGDARALAAAIASILEAPHPWRAEAAGAGARVRQRFGSAAVSERLEALYHDVLHQRRRAA